MARGDFGVEAAGVVVFDGDDPPAVLRAAMFEQLVGLQRQQ